MILGSINTPFLPLDMSHLKTLEQKEYPKDGKKKKVKLIAEVNKTETKKSRRQDKESMKPRAESLRKSVILLYPSTN